MAATPALAESFPEAVEAGQALRTAGLTVAVAESCTGGLLGAALTAVPGSSAYVLGGVIAYADAVKVSLLGVPVTLLATDGAVSEAVAQAMASGVRAALGAGVGLAVTGVAGPGAEDDGKPAGLVWVACSGPGAAMRSVRLDGDLGREANRAGAVRAALRLCVAAVGASR
jgi:PncC family amidohydrolase